MLPAGKRADAPHCAVYRSQSGAVALSPHHAFVIGRRDLPPVLNQAAVGIEYQLRVIYGAASTLVDTDRYNHSRLSAGITDGVGGGGGYRDGFFQLPVVL